MSRCYPRVCGFVMRHPKLNAISQCLQYNFYYMKVEVGKNASSITKLRNIFQLIIQIPGPKIPGGILLVQLMKVL